MNPRILRPESLADACALLSQDEDALVYGGGTALQILRKQGILSASSFVDISGISGLNNLHHTGNELLVGPMVSIRRMETDPVVRESVPIASAAYAKVANPRVRNTATVGGNIAHGDYRLDPPVALLVLGTTIKATSTAGTRAIPIDKFFIDFQLTALNRGEIVTSIEIPISNDVVASTFVKFSSLSANDWPSASAAAAIFARDGEAQILRLALGALAPTPVMTAVDITGMREAQATEAAVESAMLIMDPLPDVRGGVEYKRNLGRIAVEDAVRNLWRDRQSV